MLKIKPTFSKRLALNIHNRYVSVQTQLHELNYLFWECTKRCNLNCAHCGSDCSSSSGINDMPAIDFLQVTEQISQHYNANKIMIVITGGEPLMRKDLHTIGTKLKKQGFYWGMVTNALALDEKRFNELLQAGLSSITVSIDGMKEQHNSLRKHPTSFAKAMQAIELFVKEPSLIFDVVTCVHQDNLKDLPLLKQELINKGVKRWRIFTIDPIGRAATDKRFSLNGKELLQLLEFIKETRKENDIKVDYGCEGYTGNYENEVRDGYFFCRAGINIASVLIDGSISACQNNHCNMVQGNIYKDDFIEVWEERYEKMRDRQWMKTGICSNCDQFRFCKGNGLHLRNPDTNETMRCHYEMLENAIS